MTARSLGSQSWFNPETSDPAATKLPEPFAYQGDKSMNLPRTLVILLVTTLLSVSALDSLFGQTRTRKRLRIPDIPGFTTLVCDFHMHTVFSDGKVWPTVRVDEAWREGLDVISLTEHVEYRPFKQDIPIQFNRAYEVAKPVADDAGILLIHGAEITRPMPPGHINALFLTDAALLQTDTWQDAVKAAVSQDAFVFWNHPGWQGQQPDGIARWYSDHSFLLDRGWLHGIEVVNHKSYYPRAHRWALEKGLTMLGNSDNHNPISMDYDPEQHERRPVTLVFAADRSIKAIKNALSTQHTAVLWQNKLIGEERFLRPLFDAAITVNHHRPSTSASMVVVDLVNDSDLEFVFVRQDTLTTIQAPMKMKQSPQSTTRMVVRKRSNHQSAADSLHYVIENAWTTPENRLSVVLPITWPLRETKSP